MFAPVTSMERPPCSGGQCWRGVTSSPRLSVRLCSLPRRCPSVLSGNPCQVSSLHDLPQRRSRDGATHTATAAERTLPSLTSLLGNDAGPKDAPQLLITLQQLRSDCQQRWLVVCCFLCSGAMHLYAADMLHEALSAHLTSNECLRRWLSMQLDTYLSRCHVHLLQQLVQVGIIAGAIPPCCGTLCAATPAACRSFATLLLAVRLCCLLAGGLPLLLLLWHYCWLGRRLWRRACCVIICLRVAVFIILNQVERVECELLGRSVLCI